MGAALEDRVAVAKAALRSIQAEAAPCANINGIKAMEAVLQLHAISANVLHRSCACSAWDKRHIFKPCIALL